MGERWGAADLEWSLKETPPHSALIATRFCQSCLSIYGSQGVLRISSAGDDRMGPNINPPPKIPRVSNKTTN